MVKTKDEAMQKTISTFRLDGVDDRLLQALGRFHYLTARQVTNLYYKAGSFTTVQARLKRLADNGYLLPLALPTIRAKSPFVYTLATKGREYLVELGFDLPGVVFSSVQRTRKRVSVFQSHPGDK